MKKLLYCCVTVTILASCSSNNETPSTTGNSPGEPLVDSMNVTPSDIDTLQKQPASPKDTAAHVVDSSLKATPDNTKTGSNNY